MPNVAAVTLLNRYIEERKIKPMKKWSERVTREKNNPKLHRNVRVKIRQIRNILFVLSGGDIVEMLKDVLNQKERDALSLPKYKKVLEDLTETYKKTDLKQRHHLVRVLKDAKFNHNELRRLGYGVSRGLWKSCQDTRERNKGGGQSISANLQQSIESYLNEHSTIASNRLIKNKNRNHLNYKRFVPARYLEECKTELYKKSPFVNLICKSTFFKYSNMNGEYKNPHRLTDLCEYCEVEIGLKKKLTQVVKEENYEYQTNYDITRMIKDFNEKLEGFKNQLNEDYALKQTADERKHFENCISKYKTINDELRDYEALIFHKHIAHSQRLAYNKHHRDADQLRNKIMIEFDFKQKIMIGLSPRQVNNEYYNQESRTCLGFGVYYVDAYENIKVINFDVISSDQHQDAFAVVRALKLLRQQDFFKKIEQKDYIVWSDTGRHFRNNEVLGYFLKELAQEGIHVNFNFFGEKHGKNGRDAHFSNVAKFVKAESLVRKLSTSQDVADAIMKRQHMAHENNLHSQVISYAVALDEEIAEELRVCEESRKISIGSLMTFYNFRTVGPEYEIVTSVLSNKDYDNYKPIRITAETTTTQTKSNGVQSASSEETNAPSYIRIHTKKARIKAALEELQVENNRNDDEGVDFFNYFSLDFNTTKSEVKTKNPEIKRNNSESTAQRKKPKIIEIEETFIGNPQPIKKQPEIIETIKPRFCRGQDQVTKTKAPCVSCNAPCAYKIEDINNSSISQQDVRKELVNHHHPQTRKNQDGKFMSTVESRRELIDHYIHAHNMKRPDDGI